MLRRLAMNLKGGVVVAAVLAAALAGGARSASAQAGPNLLGAYAMMSNQSPVVLHIQGWAPLSNSSSGEPRIQITGYVAEAGRQDAVVGEAVGSDPNLLRLAFHRTLSYNGIVQRYTGAASRTSSGRWVLAGTFAHNGAGFYPWFATRQ